MKHDVFAAELAGEPFYVLDHLGLELCLDRPSSFASAWMNTTTVS